MGDTAIDGNEGKSSKVPRILTKYYQDTTNGCIVANGFTFKSTTYRSDDVYYVYYIAIKF